MNVDNLLRAADYIETIPQESFNMVFFRSNSNDLYNQHCGSVGCIIGHCTILDDKDLPLNVYGEIDFLNWSYDFFGLKGNKIAWNYLFGPSWEKLDNTPIGAAKRLRYVAEHGIPNNARGEMYGREPLSYV